MAQTVPRSFVASPEIHRVVAQDNQYLVIESNWKPGQRDKFHSTPAYLSYNVTDCHLRRHLPVGQIVDYGTAPAGYAAQMQAVDSYAVENVGKSDCRVITFAPK